MPCEGWEGLEKSPVLGIFWKFLGACCPIFVIWVTFLGVLGGVPLWGQSPELSGKSDANKVVRGRGLLV